MAKKQKYLRLSFLSFLIMPGSLQEVSSKPCFYHPNSVFGGGGGTEVMGRVEVGFENGNHFLLENMCVIVVGGVARKYALKFSPPTPHPPPTTTTHIFLNKKC